MSSPPLALHDPDDFPTLYRATNRSSLESQVRFLRALRIRLSCLLLATVGGAIGFSIFGFAVGGIVAFLSFVVALSAGLYLETAKPDRAWYEGRAAAESVKTLAWRFAVKGESFDGGSDEVADSNFIAELKSILTDLVALDAEPNDGDRQITSAMRNARGASFDDRRDLYRSGRIVDQQGWYASKANWNKVRSQRWFAISVVAEGFGVLAAALMAFGVMQIDFLGVIGAVATAATAWTQAKQHSNLATAYSVTALELASVLSELDSLTTEPRWAKFVGQAEEAISREHILWRASRGIRIKNRG